MTGLWALLLLVQVLHLSLDVRDLFDNGYRLSRMRVALTSRPGVGLSLLLLFTLGVMRNVAPISMGCTTLFATTAPTIRLYAAVTRQGLLDLFVHYEAAVGLFLVGVTGQLLCLGGLGALPFLELP